MKKFSIIAISLCAMLGLYQPAVEAASSRYNWVVQEIYNYNHPFAAQLPGELATKMSKMSAGAFAFYRGTAHIFYKDMLTLPASNYVNYATSYVWLEGDMHVQNMGGLRDANGNDVFDTSDFDEGYWGAYVWDLRRMAASILLAAKENEISSSDREQLVRNFLESYLTQLDNFKGNDSETTYRLTTSNTNGVVKDTIQAAAAKSRSDLLSKYTTLVGGNRQFQTLTDLQPVSSSVYSSIQTAMSDYILSIPSSKRYSNSYYTLKDVRQKLGSGVGSLGRYRYFLLIEGSSSSTSDDAILEMKEETSSAVAIAAPNRMPSSYYNDREGQRVTTSMKAMLNNTDKLVGYVTVSSKPYMIREKSPYQKDFDYTKLTTYDKFNDAVEYFGKIVAKNHALADKDYDSNMIPYSMDKEIGDVVSGNKSAFKTEILNFALDYAAQVELDYANFLNAYQNNVPLY